MYTIVKNLITQLFSVPAGEFTNWLLMAMLSLFALYLIFK